MPPHTIAFCSLLGHSVCYTVAYLVPILLYLAVIVLPKGSNEKPNRGGQHALNLSDSHTLHLSIFLFVFLCTALRFGHISFPFSSQTYSLKFHLPRFLSLFFFFHSSPVAFPRLFSLVLVPICPLGRPHFSPSLSNFLPSFCRAALSPPSVFLVCSFTVGQLLSGQGHA